LRILWASVAAGSSLLGCSATPSTTPLRSLQSSGPLAFVCLGAPGGDASSFARPLSDCSAIRTDTIDDYSVPHLYALVTQPVQGEVAIVDLTTTDGSILDQDPNVPGASFLPVGAAPTDIVATTGGMASFVAAAEPGFEGIYALPSTLIRASATRLSSWPSCALPAAPGAMLLAFDPPDDNGLTRPSCDASYGAQDSSTCGADHAPHCHGDLSAEAGTTGKTGRQKLIIALPSEGGFAVLDAQNVLDREAGGWAPCTIERWIPLAVDFVAPPPPTPPPAVGCVNEQTQSTQPLAQSFAAQPSDMALDDRRLYVADSGSPVIHVVDMPTPCAPIERPGLLALSAENPERVVTTTRIALSPPTLDLKRFLYAIDDVDGSLMFFDISNGSTTRTPVQRNDTGINPFQPADRIRFQVPPRALISLEHLNDTADPSTGSSVPVRCDPNPDSTGPGAIYRTASTYDSGARPTLLRGVFSFVVLASGDIVTIDVDDYDSPCRGPIDQHPLYGCSTELDNLVTSGEYSCRTVQAHEPRGAGFLVNVADIATNVPGLQDYPALFDPSGSVLNIDDETPAGKLPPRIRASVPVSAPPSFQLVVGTTAQSLDPQTGELLTATGAVNAKKHVLAMNLEEPRVHLANQAWAMTYEGPLPGFDSRLADLEWDADGTSLWLTDPSSRFCDSGVLSTAAYEDILPTQGETPAQTKIDSATLADYVQLTSSTPVESDTYWQSQSECTYLSCRNEFGSAQQPSAARELSITEAWPERLLVQLRGRTTEPADATLKCCFPGVVSFWVRAGGQWVVVSDRMGLIHHVVSDPATGSCRLSCDPRRARENGRAREVAAGTVLSDNDPRAFINPFFRFYMTRGQACDDQGQCKDQPTKRDTYFTFSSAGAFVPLTLSLVSADLDVQPQAIEYLGPTGELVVSDGSLQGITLLDLNSLAITRQYY